jgi:hypothetical protein
MIPAIQTSDLMHSLVKLKKGTAQRHNCGSVLWVTFLCFLSAFSLEDGDHNRRTFQFSAYTRFNNELYSPKLQLKKVPHRLNEGFRDFFVRLTGEWFTIVRRSSQSVS